MSSHHNPALPEIGFIRQAQLIPAIVPFSNATLWRKVKDGTFPAPVKLSPRVTAWDGEVAGDEIKQQRAIMRTIRDYLNSPHDRFKGYVGTPDMHRDGVVPYPFIMQRVRAMAAFRGDSGLPLNKNSQMRDEELREIAWSVVVRNNPWINEKLIKGLLAEAHNRSKPRHWRDYCFDYARDIWMHTHVVRD